MNNLNLAINKMATLTDLEQRFKDLQLNVKEVRSLKKSLEIKGRWNKEKYSKFFEKYRPSTEMELLEKAKQLGFVSPTDGERANKVQLEKFIEDRTKKNLRNARDRKRRAEARKPSAPDVKKRFKDLQLSIAEVRTLKKRFDIKGSWTNEKYTKFLENYRPTTERELLEKAKQLGFVPPTDGERANKVQLEKFIEDRTKKNLRNARDRKRRAEARKKREEEIQKATTNNLIVNDKFQEVFDRLVSKGITLTAVQVNNLLNKIINRRYNLEIKTPSSKQDIPINQNTIDFISSILQNGLVEIDKEFGSDAIDNIEIMDIEKITLYQLTPPENPLKNKDGRFFPYINTSNLDLVKYQIFTQEQAYNKKLIENREHCLIFTLLQAGIEADVCNRIKLSYVSGQNISKKDLKNIASIIRRNITLYTINDKPTSKKLVQQQKITTSDPCEVEPIEIALYEEHYFLYECTEYTEFFIKHYQDLKDIENPNTIREIKHVGGKTYFGRKEGLSKISSLLMIYNLKLQNCFSKLDFTLFDENAINIQTRKHIYLDNIQNEQREVEIKKEYVPKPKSAQRNPSKPTHILEGVLPRSEPSIFYADCESFVNTNPHRLFLLGVVSNKNDLVIMWNVCDNSPEQTVFNFLNFVSNNGKQDAIVYFHNLKYDLHLLEPYINIKEKCMKDNQIYSLDIYYRGKNIELRDSYKLIPFALKTFQESFELPKEYCKKEASAYKYYTPENNNKRIHIDEYMNLLKEEDKTKFVDNMKDDPEYDIKTKTFNPLSYYMEYLRLDCLVLKKGLIKFNELIKEITGGLTIYKSLTISSLTDKYMTENGAYEGVFEVCGNLREYIANAVYGGRVCVNEKYSRKVVEGKLSDYDGVSLYPSAINRLCREIGLPTGEAKRLNGQDWRNFKYSIVTVQITKVNKKQQMPFIAHKGDGVINYTNEPPKEPIVIDSITLQDYIDFHEIEFEVSDGVYWDGKFNQKMGELINNLFKSRMVYKKSKPALANTIKLMLNSSYGKTIMKKSNSEVKMIFRGEEVDNYDKSGRDRGTNFENYVYNNFNTLISSRTVNKYNYEIVRICADKSYNRGHIGCAILSMSKRIMNEVFDVANDIECPIYYTDTDSLHCNFDDVPKIEAKYKEVYGKELNGKNLEQFHTDFNLKGADSEIYATKSIFLGKKSYCDYLESKDKSGRTINGYHIRLKGITKEGLDHASEEYEDSYFGLYKDLASGITKRILLNPKDKVLFEYKSGYVSTKTEFFREVKFL